MTGVRSSVALPDTDLGFSVGHMEGKTLVVHTTHASGNRLFMVYHSDQLEGEERYYVSGDGALLNMDTSFTDPVALSSPLTLKKIWGGRSISPPSTPIPAWPRPASVRPISAR